RLRGGLGPPRARGTNDQWHSTTLGQGQDVAAAIDATITSFTDRYRIARFDLVLLRGDAFRGQWRSGPVLTRHITKARCVFVDGINWPAGFHAHTVLTTGGDHAVVDIDGAVRGGYAILRARGCHEVAHDQASRPPERGAGVPASVECRDEND